MLSAAKRQRRARAGRVSQEPLFLRLLCDKGSVGMKGEWDDFGVVG
jgi:hypothetical protein